jgi:hypothetical protein
VEGGDPFPINSQPEVPSQLRCALEKRCFLYDVKSNYPPSTLHHQSRSFSFQKWGAGFLSNENINGKGQVCMWEGGQACQHAYAFKKQEAQNVH